MTSKEEQMLKPCPFCGAEGRLLAIGMHVFDHRKGCFYGESWRGLVVYDQEVEAWNTRAAADPSDFSAAVHNGEAWQRVRTCTIEKMPYEPGRWEGCMCSLCGATDEYHELNGNYCPNCGARVVG